MNQRKVSSLHKLLWTALQAVTQKQKLGVSIVCHGCNINIWKYVKSQKQETVGIAALKTDGNVITDQKLTF